MKKIYFGLFGAALLASCSTEHLVTATPLVETYGSDNIQNTSAITGGNFYNDAGSAFT
jgi:hypothetical protein